MTQREFESLAPSAGDSDPHALLFGDDDDDLDHAPVKLTRADRRRSEVARRRGRKRRGRLFVLLTIVLVAAVALLVVPKVIDYFKVPDYSGTGTGAVSVTIPTGASASDIAALLKKADVVKSTKAFTDAAADNSKSQDIQPGRYTLRAHMSGKAAVAALLDPTTRNASSDLLVPEGATSLDVAAHLGKLYAGTDSAAKIPGALKATADLGVPVTYKIGSKFPSSVEGFLFPATYNFDPAQTPAETLTKMVSRFIAEDRNTGFASDAKKVGLTPYQALIVASIAQSEAKYPEDMPKVVRTILNRVHKGTPLQFDSTSSYACKVAGVAATKCIYHQVDSPFNTYTHSGLPPTPIDNPGADAMNAAVHPAVGNWLFFVNKDKAGHLFFTNDEKAWAKAAQKCAANNWGCG